jgi:hypothetical protein
MERDMETEEREHKGKALNREKPEKGHTRERGARACEYETRIQGDGGGSITEKRERESAGF